MTNNLSFLDKIITKLVIFASIAIFTFILFHPISTPGGELLFLPPLSLLVCTLLFPKLIEYQKDGWGLKVFYTVILVRYLLLPLITCFEGSFATGGLPCYALTHISNPIGYRYALICMCIELFVSLWTINHFYDKADVKYLPQTTVINKYPTLSILGAVVTLFFLYLIVSRGGISSFIRIGVVSEELDYDSQTGHHGIDVDIIKPLMGFLVITVIAFFRKKYDASGNFFNFIFAISFSLLSCVLIVGNNRMQMVYLSLCAIAVLTKSFPKYDKTIRSVIIPLMVAILISFTLLKQFGISVSTGGINDVQNDDAIVGLTEYVCGPENTAHTYDVFLTEGHNVSFNTFVADFIKYNFCTRLPVFSSLRDIVTTEPTVIDLSVERSEMISISGQCLFYGKGIIGGFLLTALSFFIIARLLVFFEIKSKKSEELSDIYIYNWCAILSGVSMCYCIVTLWANITYVPVWIWALLKINNLARK